MANTLFPSLRAARLAGVDVAEHLLAMGPGGDVDAAATESRPSRGFLLALEPRLSKRLTPPPPTPFVVAPIVRRRTKGYNTFDVERELSLERLSGELEVLRDHDPEVWRCLARWNICRWCRALTPHR